MYIYVCIHTYNETVYSPISLKHVSQAVSHIKYSLSARFHCYGKSII